MPKLLVPAVWSLTLMPERLVIVDPAPFDASRTITPEALAQVNDAAAVRTPARTPLTCAVAADVPMGYENIPDCNVPVSAEF
jgi:hypothetical protein